MRLETIRRSFGVCIVALLRIKVTKKQDIIYVHIVYHIDNCCWSENVFLATGVLEKCISGGST